MLLSILFVNIALVISSCAHECIETVDWNNITADSNVNELFEIFKIKFNKNYKSVDEESMRFQIFANNVKTICEHNEQFKADLTTYKMGLNKYSDYTFEEFKKMMGLLS